LQAHDRGSSVLLPITSEILSLNGVQRNIMEEKNE